MRSLALAALLLIALATAARAEELPCASHEDVNACPVATTDGGVQGGVVVWGDGFYADALAQQGTGLFGGYVYAVPLVWVEGIGAAHGGLGMADRDYDGTYEDAFVGGAVQSVVYVPFGVGVYDSDHDGRPDSVHHEPQLS